MWLQDLKQAPGCSACFVALRVNIFSFISSVCCVLMLHTMIIVIYYGSQEAHQGLCQEQNLWNNNATGWLPCRNARLIKLFRFSIIRLCIVPKSACMIIQGGFAWGMASWVIWALVNQFNVYKLQNILYNDYIRLQQISCPNNNITKCCLRGLLIFTHHHVLLIDEEIWELGNFSGRACRIDGPPHGFPLKEYFPSLMLPLSIATVECTAANYGLMPGCLTLEADTCNCFKMQVNHRPSLYFIRFSFANISHAERCDSLKKMSACSAGLNSFDVRLQG